MRAKPGRKTILVALLLVAALMLVIGAIIEMLNTPAQGDLRWKLLPVVGDAW